MDRQEQAEDRQRCRHRSDDQRDPRELRRPPGLRQSFLIFLGNKPPRQAGSGRAINGALTWVPPFATGAGGAIPCAS